MTSIISLWLPILVSAVFVFIASSVIHMFLRYHQSDFDQVPDESNVMDSLREYNIPPGDYFMPRANSSKEMHSEAFREKYKRGPVVAMTVLNSSTINMTPSLIRWFVYCIVVGIFVAYITANAASAEADYLEIFRFAGCTAFMGYALAMWQDHIWMKKKLSSVLKSTFDGLIYGLLTGGVFGWLWPA